MFADILFSINMHLFNFFCFSLLIMNCSTSVNAGKYQNFIACILHKNTKSNETQWINTLVGVSNWCTLIHF